MCAFFFFDLRGALSFVGAWLTSLLLSCSALDAIETCFFFFLFSLYSFTLRCCTYICSFLPFTLISL